MKPSALTPAAATRRAVLLCVATTVVIAAVELTIGLTFNLLSVTAEGLHTAADLLDSLVALALITVALRPPDREHPYGHGKFDSLAGMVEGICVGASGIWALYAAGRVLLGVAQPQPRPEPLALIAMAVASIVYLFVSRYVLRLAARTGSPAVYAEGMHLRTHIYVTAGLFVGVLLSWYGLLRGWERAAYIDPAITVLLGLFLVAIGVRIVLSGYRQLLDSALPSAERDRIAACLGEFRHEFIEVHSLRTRQAGTDRHIDIHLVVPGEMTVDAAHELAHRIEQRVRQALPSARLLVHVEPAVGEILKRYAERGQAGIVIADEPTSAGREATHHGHPNAHQP